MVKFANILSRLNSVNILVVGDMMMDSYTIGKAKRISPEAPVAVVNVFKEEHKAGGAGNVILNLLSLGAKVRAIGRVGADWAGRRLIESLEEESVDTQLIVCQEDYRTPVKNRIIADNQQIVRIDHEQVIPLPESLEERMIEQLSFSLKEIDLVAISDYGKGFLTPALLSAIYCRANEMGIPIVTDPKGLNFHKYYGTTIIKPNLSEAYSAAKLPPGSPLEEVASIVLQQTNAELLMVTRSEAGISLFDKGGNRYDFPVHAKEVKDVTGAGDTVLAMFAHALANRLSFQEAAQLCNIAAGLAIEHVGCARVSVSDLALRLFEQNAGHKIFNEDHLFILKEILKRDSFTLLFLLEVDQLTPALFQQIKNITREGEPLVIQIDAIESSEICIEMLASMKEVSFIVHSLESVKTLCQSIAPNKSFIYDADQTYPVACEWSYPLESRVH